MFRHRGFRIYWSARLLTTAAMQFLSVAVGWYVYDLTHDPLDLGLVGLCQFLPFLALFFLTGAAADRFERRRIMAVCIGLQLVCVSAIVALVATRTGSVLPIFGLLVLFGSARAFYGPADRAITPNLVPTEELSTAIAWNSSGWQFVVICGPVVGGLLYGVAPELPFAAAGAFWALALVQVLRIPPVPRATGAAGALSWQTVSAGFRYIWQEKVVLGAITLDLFAVLLGGATALLPAYARDILAVGPTGLGLLRSAPGIGALAMALFLIRRPIRQSAGVLLFVAVGGFGLFTCVFGLSTAPGLSIGALAAIGALDMVSVYVRETLIQVWTPDALRGRVNAVNLVFIGASNELGEFRAGVMAALIGVVPAVVVGGAGTLLVALVASRLFPQLRRVDHLDRPEAEAA
ncbi:Transmembrane secretion effector [Tistlia consotensis]|uniref:Transmembrane secretion effector n=1 Tax=Tistlia consotensis USBA 355 TaxID=560819 RepID=A0A1Y6CMA5_9PROT|nr:MFS transporter [Tistlia consotensis]SMF64250.1 Transmembrane secretion effector [Tistlia consotensis USBA 355]SNR97638.1 Transmembrane secretion effector [Tistlia consotensis]